LLNTALNFDFCDFPQDETIDNELETHFRSNDIGLFTNCTLTDADKKLVS